MKRLRVLLVCLIVALLCWYPSQHVYCSEQSSAGQAQSAGDKTHDGQRQEQEPDSQHKVLEEWPAQTSYDVGLETERAALERQEIQNMHQEQTVNPQEAEMKETKPDQESDTEPLVPEPVDPQADANPQTDPHSNKQEVPVLSTPESPPAQDQVSTDDPAPAELFGDAPDAQPSLESQLTTSPDEAENAPTSGSDSQTHTDTAQVAIAGDEPPLDNFVYDEHSDSQCGVMPPKLATCEYSPFGSPLLRVDDAVVEDQLANHSSGPETEAQPTHGHVEQGLRQDGVLEDGPSGLDLLDKTLPPHKEQKVPARETDPSVPSKEDIPTFDEWKKQVMEVEMEKSQSLHTSTSGSTLQVKKVQKNFKNNYASVECGAKILSANSEAKSTSSILKENMDLYMLNPCSTKIWFVIELCEPIQVKQLDIANFELFSSTPKDFLVSISDRYPTSKWLKLGTFHARDERIVQTFPLDEQLFAKYLKMFIKYIKVELLSHFGSEHFCPLSLFRVFGTSMVEEYEEIADSQYLSERLEYLDEDYDYPPGYQPSEDNPNGSKNLLGSATNAILNMVNNIAANVLGGAPELEGGIETGGNTTAEKGESGSPEVSQKALEKGPDSEILESAESEQLASQESSSVSAGLSPSSPDSPEERQIVTLVEEEEEEEEDQEHKQSTVTLMEEEEDDKREEETRDADRNYWDSQAYCPFSSLSLSCVATLPELLHRWCSARLTKERLRSLRRRQLSVQTRSHTDANSPFLSLTPLLIPAPAPTSVKDSPPLTEVAAEPEAPIVAPNDGNIMAEVHTTHPDTPDAPTPELNILLEPSRTVSIPPHSFSVHSSLSSPTPTHDEELSPPIKDAAMDPLPTSTLQVVTILETQQASSATPTLTVSLPLQPAGSESASPVVVVPPVVEQPIQALPTASRPEDLIPPPTELPTPLPVTDTLTDPVKSGVDSGELQGVQLPQTNGDQGDAATGEPQRVDDTVEEDLLSANGNGNVQRTATDFYAELQNGADYNGGAMNGNGVLLNGGAVHGSSQKESVFMRLNNRIKALEMNMSLSSRYLEELSQRYRKQMEEMQKAFNKTIIKLQNTSRIAQEQDQKQTDSIQVLQSQLENVTRLMLNLTVTVGQLQREVSDRQSYLVVSLVLCLFLGLVLCLQCCRSSSPSPKTSAATLPKSNHYPSPKRCFSSYDDMSLKRRVTCPLVRSKSFHLCSTEVGPDDLYIVEPLRFSPEKKKKRCKTKSLDKVDTLKEYDPSAPITNGGLECNGFHPCLPERPSPSPIPLPPPLPPLLPPPPPPPSLPPSLEEVSSLSACTIKESTSETSSCCSSSHSEETPASHLPPSAPIFPSSARLCNGHGLSLPVQQIGAKTRQEKRSVKRRKSRQAELQFPTVPSLQQLMKGNKDISVGTIGVTAVTGHV